jgi:hypothetical protein
MSTLATFSAANYAPKFYCESCDYGTCKKSSYDNHILSAKHKKSTFSNLCQPNFQQIQQSKFTCENCNKEYKDKSGLWRHKQKCNIPQNSNKSPEISQELILTIIKQNSELQQTVIEQSKTINEMSKNIQTTNSHNNNNTHSHNKTFNLQFFLNETCKDAMNITDFVDSIKLQLSDLIKVGEIGYVEGISNIITKNLNALDVTQRPVHCTDKKREVLYVKDENKWEKEDEDKNKIRKVIKKVMIKNQRLLPEYKEKYPDYNKSSSKVSDQYNTIIVESMGGRGDNDFEKENKIIKNITKVTTID